MGAAARLVAVRDPARWDAAASASGQPVTPFHSYRWLKLSAGMTGTRFTPMVLTERGTDVGVVPLLVRRRGPARTLNWVPFPYVGPLVPGRLLGPALAFLVRYGRTRCVVQNQLCFPPGADVDRALLDTYGFAVHEDRTFRIDLRASEEALWAGLEGRARTKIKKAFGSGVRIGPAANTQALGDVVDAVFRAKSLRSGYTEAFPPSIEELSALGMQYRVAVAELGEHPVGSMVSLMYAGSALLWQGGVLPEHRQTNANTALFWDGIVWARSMGATTVDLVGLPDAGIERFKRQFGGTLESYVVARRPTWVWTLLEGR
jgi:CelD/BcsL family acetyltransferase involved in cellulose biosynthesis